MTAFEYSSIPQALRNPKIGLIVLQSDETVETEIHQWLPPQQYDVLVSRVPSGDEVTEDTLAAMAGEITRSAQLFPANASEFDAVAYCCTSGTSVIGAEKVAELVRKGCHARAVTNPLTALVHACQKRGISQLAFLSPYIEAVSERLRSAIADQGIQSPVFGSFNEAEEAKVAWIDEGSVCQAAESLAAEASVEGVFLSCTNLKTIGLLGQLEARIGKPVLSSNAVLAEHLSDLAAG